ncbi:MAG: alpha/beta hydrolase [Saprospiraceae bacterium]|nr:alpha/beta hydrolase [Saprospiraceae bacterium]
MRSHCCILVISCTFWLQSISLHGQSTDKIAIDKDIIYGHAGGVDLKLDIGKPDGPGPFPVVLFLSWWRLATGIKSHMHRWIRQFVVKGYVGVSVGYRFAPRFKWPSQVEDAKQAVRYLRTCRFSHIDPKRISAMGESAGAYLALMLGVTAPKDSLEGQTNLPQYSSKVQAVVSYFSATDFTLRGPPLTPALEAAIQQYYKKSLKEVRADFTGASSLDDPILKKISVLHYVDKTDDAPVLIFHGDQDPYA